MPRNYWLQRDCRGRRPHEAERHAIESSEETTPVGSNLSFEAYCEALGLDAADTRTASVAQALYYRLERADWLLSQSTQESQESLKHSA